MRLANITNGVVTNVIDVDPANVPAWAANWVDIGSEGGPGWMWDGSVASPPPPPSAADLDIIADRLAEELLEQDAKMKALGLVLADVVERAFGVSQSVARQQVKTRFRDYYRALLG